MPWYLCFILGVVQGITEFLPISSSGHLVIMQTLFNLQTADKALILFDCLLHIATLLAVVVFLGRSIIFLLKDVFDSNVTVRNGALKYIVMILITTVITGIIGVMFKDTFERVFNSAKVVALLLIVNGTVIWFSQKVAAGRKVKELNKISILDSLWIGIAQGLAITPGISRSGSTISAAFVLGWSPVLAAEYSFLSSIPAIAGATLLELLKMEYSINPGMMLSFGIGMIAAFAIGFVSLKFLWGILIKRNWQVFAYYCWATGLAMFVLFSIK
ncbi:MAG: undecaprenyl-diphosphate phosphatase [Elusimicrobiota bacterium]